MSEKKVDPFECMVIDYMRCFSVADFRAKFGAVINEDPFLVYDVPREVVVYSPRIFTPLQGRVFATGRYDLGDGNFASYETLRVHPGFDGVNNIYAVYVVEVWEDCGSDGHVEYKLEGFRFVKCKGDPAKIVTCECGECHRFHRPGECLTKLYRTGQEDEVLDSYRSPS